jgi:holo-[acyl-carrier protein] synthase
MDEGIAGHAVAVVSIDDMAQALAQKREDELFTDEEKRYARSKSDPVRRLAARWAAKQAAAQVLGIDAPRDIELFRAHGAPSLRLTGEAALRHRAMGGGALHVSITHGLAHAAATVVLESPVP